MIFLGKHGLLFLKARKVAGTSFEIALSRFAGPDDIITPIAPDDEEIGRQRGFAGPRNYRKRLSELGGLAAWIRQSAACLNINDKQYLIDGADVIDHHVRFEDLPGGTKAQEEIKPGLAGMAEHRQCHHRRRARSRTHRRHRCR